MNKKRVYVVLFALVLLTLFAASAYAALLDPILQPLSRIDIPGTYARYGFVIDSILYFVILVGAAMTGLGERFKDQKSIAVAVGIALAIAAAIGEQRTGFRLGTLWPLALVMVFLAIGFGIYNYFKKISGTQNRGYAMLAFAFLWFYFQSAAPGLAKEFASSKNEYVALIWSLMNIIALVCLAWGIISLVIGIAKWGSQEATTTAPTTTPGQTGPSWWQRHFGAKPEEDLDYSNPGTLVVTVIDESGKPISGAEVIIKGEKLKYRLPVVKKIWKKWTQPPEGNVTFEQIPSGLLVVEARHPGYKFWKFYASRTSSRHTTLNTVFLEGGGTAEVTVQLKSERKYREMISGRVIDSELARRKNIEPTRGCTGGYLNKKFRRMGGGGDNIGVGGVAVAAMKNNNILSSTVTNEFGDFQLTNLPLEDDIIVAVIDPANNRIISTHMLGIYGRGGNEGLIYNNPGAAKPISLSAKHRQEEYVVVAVNTRRDEHGNIIEVYPLSAQDMVASQRRGEGEDTQEPDVDETVGDAVREVAKEEKREILGIEEAKQKLELWVEKLTKIIAEGKTEVFIGAGEEVKRLREDIKNFEERLNITYKEWRESSAKVKNFLKIDFGNIMNLNEKSFKDYALKKLRKDSGLRNKNKSEIYNNERANDIYLLVQERANNIKHFKVEWERYKKLRDDEIKKSIEELKKATEKEQPNLSELNEIRTRIVIVLRYFEDVDGKARYIMELLIRINSLNEYIKKGWKDLIEVAKRQAAGELATPYQRNEALMKYMEEVRERDRIRKEEFERRGIEKVSPATVPTTARFPKTAVATQEEKKGRFKRAGGWAAEVGKAGLKGISDWREKRAEKKRLKKLAGV